MEETLRQWLIDRDERAIEDAYFDDNCQHFFAVDWREDDAEIVRYCAQLLGEVSIGAEWRGDLLVISRDGSEMTVPLANDEGDRDITVRSLNDLLQPDYEIRFLVCSHGSDTAGFAVLPAADWQSLDDEVPESVLENFVKLSLLPNIFTAMTDEHLPADAHARFQRMLDRNRG